MSKQTLTFASRNVAEFFHDLLVWSVAPRSVIDQLRHGRIAAVVGNVVQLDFWIRHVICEELDVVVRVRMRPLIVPRLTLNSRYSAAHFTDIVFTPRCTQTFSVECLPVNFFWQTTNASHTFSALMHLSRIKPSGLWSTNFTYSLHRVQQLSSKMDFVTQETGLRSRLGQR